MLALVVNDNPEQCKALQRRLETDGYQVRASTSLCEAVARIGRENFGAVIIDGQLGSVRTFGLLALMKEGYPRPPHCLIFGVGPTHEPEVVSVDLEQARFEYPFAEFHTGGELAVAVDRFVSRHRVG